MTNSTPRLEATITVNRHPVKVIVEGSGARTPQATLQSIADHVRRIEGRQETKAQLQQAQAVPARHRSGPKFSASREQIELISKIADRAVAAANRTGIDYTKSDALMDIDACISNGCPLKLEALLAADDFNFSHDVFGIRRHINRSTGRLEDFFLPRFADLSQVTA